jgi:hypothetical protein
MSIVLTERRHAPASGGPKFSAKLLAAVILAAAADLLLYDRHVGISLTIFLLLIAVGLLATGVPQARLKSAAASAAVLIFGLLPLAENVSPLSVAIALSALAAFALAVTNRLRRGLARMARQVIGFLLAVAFRFVPDMVRWRRVARKMGARTGLGWLAAWVLPVGLGAVFVLLFGIANPVVERWLDMIELWRLLELLSPARVAFWLLILVVVWGFLRPRISWFQRARPVFDLIGPVRPVPVKSPHPLGETVFGEAAILRALIVFNALFAVETVLDIAYLWGGVALPEGMTYAAYAHRGAYPLIVTALLAASFVLGATRDGSRAAGNRLIRALIYVWTAQNVLLVISSILRLDLYVGVYSLTYWRVAAFIWMGLVAVGLVLIIARIALGRSNNWLLTANLLTLSVTLYACGFVNFASVIASWNVDHRPQPGDTTLCLDTWYLTQLGPQAIPAIDRLLATPDGRAANWAIWMARTRGDLAAAHALRMQDWRAWTFRDWRLMRYLDQHPAIIRAEGQGGNLGQ